MKALSLPRAVGFYLQSRRRLGFALKSEGALLQNLLRHAQSVHHRGPLTTELALDWAQVPPPTRGLQRARRLEAVRHFARFWTTFDPRTQVPPPGLFGPAYRRVPVHIYTAGEIAALLAAARQPLPHPSRAPLSFDTLLGLLACTGLRISEALQLELADWDPTQAVLTIRQSKFGQSRYVPLSVSATTALNTYLRTRTRTFPQAQSAALFLDRRAKPLAYGQAGQSFAALRRQLGWQTMQPHPRLHDLRHTFAVECLRRWYRQGQEEINTKILSLAVYLGHRNIRHTYWYLTAVPDLLALGTQRWVQALNLEKGVRRE